MGYGTRSTGSMTGADPGRPARAQVPGGAGRTGNTGAGAPAMRKRDRLLILCEYSECHCIPALQLLQ